jgi:hypothetical protein
LIFRLSVIEAVIALFSGITKKTMRANMQEQQKMKVYRFVGGKLGNTYGKFLTAVEFIQGKGEPRFSVVVGDDNSGLYYVYDSTNEIQTEIEISENEENARFVQQAKAAVKDDSAPLMLFTEDGASLRAVVWEVVEKHPVKIKIQPDDGTWGIKS